MRRCANCAEETPEDEWIGEVCTTCHREAFDIAVNVPDDCDHDCEWSVSTYDTTDLYGNEVQITKWNCSICDELMEEDQTS